MWRILSWLGGLLARVFVAAQQNGLTDDILEKAVALVTQAAGLFDDNAKRREWVIVGLTEIGVKEHIARLAVELAVSLWKQRDGQV